jgi:hypothetical protein
MDTSRLIKRIVSTEYLLAAVVTAILFFSYAGYDWWWLFILFPLFDLSAFGYLHDKKFGALTYNIGHSLIGPAVLFILYGLQVYDWALFAGMVWIFHIFVDRSLGYGLKHSSGFEHTHLGTIGKAKKR